MNKACSTFGTRLSYILMEVNRGKWEEWGIEKNNQLGLNERFFLSL